MNAPGRQVAAFAAIALAAGTAACGSSFDPAAAIDGTWTATPARIPGIGLNFTVTDDGGQLSGTGLRQIEAGPTLSFSVTGTQVDNDITLHFAYDGGQADEFTGRLTGSTHLEGVLRHWSDVGSQASFERSAP